jgi:hypothetical protein
MIAAEIVPITNKFSRTIRTIADIVALNPWHQVQMSAVPGDVRFRAESVATDSEVSGHGPTAPVCRVMTP